MKKYKALVLTAMFISSFTLLTGCGKKEDPLETSPVETTSVYSNMRDTAETGVEETEPETSASSEIQVITDVKDVAKKKALEQAKEGFSRLNAKAAFSTTTAKDIINGYLTKVNLTWEELSQLTQDELFETLRKAGLSDEQIYSYSILTYILEAYEIGDEGEPTNYLTDTKALLELNGYDFDDIMKLQNADELTLYITAGKLTPEELNAKLYFNSMFPGVDVDAKKIIEAQSTDDILQALSEKKLDSNTLRDKAVKSKVESGKFVEQVEKLEKEKKEEEESKSNSSGGGSGSGGSGKEAAKDQASSAAPTLPEGDADKIVSVRIANGDGYVSSYTDGGSSSSTNTSGTASIYVGDKLKKGKIVVKRIVRGSEAERIVSKSNSILPGTFPTDLPDDYDLVAVKFTVTLEDKSDKEGITAPVVRVKNLSGQPIETVATRVFLIQPESEDYNNSTSTKTYWVAFMIPDTQKTFALYFGSGSGTSYIFKSSAIDVEDDD